MLDINDNPPIFSKNEYVSNLNETLEVGTEFLQVFATDPDSGKNGRLTYHIVHPDNYASHFALHPDTGWMRTRASLRCRTKREVCVLTFSKIWSLYWRQIKLFLVGSDFTFLFLYI